MTRRKISLTIIISIILLIVINIVSLSTVHIPIGDDSRQVAVEYSTEKGEYGYTLNETWYSLGNIKFEHPLKKQHFFRSCDRIKDRWPELLFA